MEYKTSVQCRSVNTQNITDIKKEIRKRNMLKSKLVSTLSWSPTFGRGSIIMWRVNFYCYSAMSYRSACVASVSNRVILLNFYCFSAMSYRSACVASVSNRLSYSFFALVPTFSTNSRGNACYAGYIQISDKIKQKYTKNKRNSGRQENSKRFIYLHQK